MNNHLDPGTKPENPALSAVGLKRAITPCFGARLIQEGSRVHFSLTEPGLMVHFSDDDALHLDQAFPLILKQLELMLTSGELSPPASAPCHPMPQWAHVRSRCSWKLRLRIYHHLSTQH